MTDKGRKSNVIAALGVSRKVLSGNMDADVTCGEDVTSRKLYGVFCRVYYIIIETGRILRSKGFYVLITMSIWLGAVSI